MTLTLDLPAELESRLAERAAAAGVPLEAAALEALAAAVLSDEEIDAILDERAAARLANREPTDLGECYTLDDLRKALGR